MPEVAQTHSYAPAGELPVIAAITPLRPQRFSRQREISDICGHPVASLEQVPAVFVTYLIAQLRKRPALDRSSRQQALQQAGELFASATLCGMTSAEYNARVCALTGLPQTVVENATVKIALAISQALEFALPGIPHGVPLQERFATSDAGGAQSVRRGDILAVVAPGNGTGVHALWPQAVALGYRVVLRPSEREPWTAQRLVAAMAAAGLQEYVALLPCEYEVVETLTDAADLSLIYGGDRLVARFAERKDVLVQGPGRSKIVIGADYPQRAALDLVFESVAGLGGAACVCTSSVLVEGDAMAFARTFCRYLSEKLKDEHQRARWLTRLSPQRLSWWHAQVDHYATALLQAPQVFASVGNTHQVMPLVMQALSLTDPLVQLELPVAAVTFVPFNRGDDLNALAPALVVTVASDDTQLIEHITSVQAIRNLYIGQVPTVWMHPKVPHDGYLAEFLMTTRGYCVRRPEDR